MWLLSNKIFAGNSKLHPLFSRRRQSSTELEYTSHVMFFTTNTHVYTRAVIGHAIKTDSKLSREGVSENSMGLQAFRSSLTFFFPSSSSLRLDYVHCCAKSRCVITRNLHYNSTVGTVVRHWEMKLQRLQLFTCLLVTTYWGTHYTYDSHSNYVKHLSRLAKHSTMHTASALCIDIYLWLRGFALLIIDVINY